MTRSGPVSTPGVAAVLEAHGVVVTKSTGDGVMGGFTSTAAALRCAVAIQQAVAEQNRAGTDSVATAGTLALRIGISVGDAVVENGDLQGTAVVEAARLCAAADGRDDPVLGGGQGRVGQPLGLHVRPGAVRWT